jgi:hypothetical protein
MVRGPIPVTISAMPNNHPLTIIINAGVDVDVLRAVDAEIPPQR